MKRFELTLVVRKDDGAFEAESINKVEADDMVQLLSQFNVMLIMVLRELHFRELESIKARAADLDIPF